MASGALVSFNPRAVEGFPDGSPAIVRVAWSPLRREPSHRAEMVNQVLLGELVSVVASSAENWLAVRAPDGYEGHTTAGSLLSVTDADAGRWRELADGYSLGLRLEEGGGPVEGVAAAAARIGRAPWGARLPAPVDLLTIMPDGRRATVACGSGGASPADGRLLAPAVRAERFPRDPAAAARTALTWMGTPYVWGGRIRSGTDCSGLVQSVFGLHGIDVPRDSRQQAEAGGAPVGAGWEQALPGDLLFFAWDGPVTHVGICLGNGMMVHSSETQGGVAVDHLGSGAFGRRLAGGYAGAVRPA